MKLNERSLVFYATCDSPADNAGFLYKRGERHTAYHRRWFVLKGNMLFYFEERDSREPVGLVVLEGCTVELCDSAEEFAFAIRFSGTKSRTYVLAADSQAAMEAWVKALSRASFDYMRLVVRELEKPWLGLPAVGGCQCWGKQHGGLLLAPLVGVQCFLLSRPGYASPAGGSSCPPPPAPLSPSPQQCKSARPH
uniref:Sesquipedalian-1 n=1 Tax=Coturnix japonica TaxID=93934 RepID=A0A8C2Y4L9_COTJA